MSIALRWSVRALSAALITIVAVLTAIALRPDLLRPTVSALLAGSLCRPVEIAGPLTVAWGPRPVVGLSGLRIGARPGPEAGPRLHVDRLTAEIDSRDLLAGRLVVDTLRASSVAVEATSAPARPLTCAPDDDAPAGRTLPLRRAEIANVTVVMRREGRPELRAEMARLHFTAAEDAMTVEADGRLADVPWRMAAHAATAASGALEFDAALDVPDGELRMAGRLETDGTLEADLSLHAEDGAALARPWGLRAPAAPVDLVGSVGSDPSAGAAASRFSLEGSIADTEIDLEGQLRNLIDDPSLAATFEIEAPSIAFLGAADLPPGPLQLAGALALETGELRLQELSGSLGGATFSGAARWPAGGTLADLTASTEVAGPDIRPWEPVLGARALPQEPFELSASLSGSDLDAELRLTTHRLRAQGTLTTDRRLAGTRLQLSAGGDDFRELAPTLRVPVAVPGAYEASADLTFEADAWHVGAIRFTTTRASGTGAVSMTDLDDTRELRIRVKLDSDDVGTLLGHAGLPLDFPEAGALELDLLRDQGGWRLPASTLTGTDYVLALTGVPGDLRAREGTALDFDLRADTLARWLELMPDLGPARPREQAFRLTGTLLADEGRLALQDGRLALTHADLAFAGTLGRAGEAVRLDVTAEGPALELALPLTLPGHTGSFRLETRLLGADRILELRDTDAQWGAGDWRGDLTVRLDGEQPHVAITGRSERLRLDTGSPGEERAQQRERLLSTTPLPLAGLRGVQGEAALRIGEFDGFGEHLTDVVLEARLVDGVIELDRFAFADTYGSLDATGRLALDGSGFEVTATGEGLDLDVLSFEGAGASLPRTDVDIRLTGRGLSPAAMAASLDGTVLLASDDGVIDSRTLQLLGGDFLAGLVQRVNPVAATRTSAEIECAVLAARAEDGDLELEPGIVVRSDRAHILLSGTLDLEDERLDLSLATRARRGIGLSAGSIVTPFLRIGGTLAGPRIRADATGGAVQLGAAAATGGISLLARGLYERVRGGAELCQQYRAALSDQSASSPESASPRR